ncbi:MAG: Hsp20/alpha crystallin family protein [Cytophagaceae bacterium]
MRNNFNGYLGKDDNSFIHDFISNHSAGHVVNSSFVPSVDVIEKDNAFELYLALPGCRKEDISLNLEERKLIVTGIRAKVADGQYKVNEIKYGKFSRGFQLPEIADCEKITAEFIDGILQIKVSKVPAKRNFKTVEIK